MNSNNAVPIAAAKHTSILGNKMINTEGKNATKRKSSGRFVNVSEITIAHNKCVRLIGSDW